MMHRATLVLAASFITLFANAVALSGETGATRLILKGHDPVAYFTDSKPVKGNPNISYDFDEGRYHFASVSHRDQFAADPERYAPQFGGYCTGSLARGVHNEGHPEAWVIVDGKLFVFGAPDSTIALQHRENAQKDLAAFRVKAAKAGKNWLEKT
jgi:YHS domain-containing protein